MRVEGHEPRIGFVQLDEMSKIGTRVTHDEALTTDGRGVEYHRPSCRFAVADGRVETRHDVGDVVNSCGRPDPAVAVFDDQFDHEVTQLTVGTRMIEIFVTEDRVAAGEFDVVNRDERTDTESVSPRRKCRFRQIGHCVGDLSGCGDGLVHVDSLTCRAPSSVLA